MYTIDQYLSAYPVSRRTVFNHILEGKLLSYKDNGRTIIVNPNEVPKLETSKQAELIKFKREEWDTAIKQMNLALASNISPAQKKEARKAGIELITNELKFWESRGLKISGYDLKSLYRKIKTGKTERERRSTAGVPTNAILSSTTVQQQILAVGWKLYGKPSAKLNFRHMCDRIKEYARKNEDFYEIAAIPDSTLTRFLKSEYNDRGLKDVHQFLNHFNLYKDTRARNVGAFTTDVKFMDYIIGDDHKGDIDKVLVWDEIRKEWKKETVRGWYWIEGKTQKVLGYILLARDITAEDLKLSLIEVLQKYGKPNKSIMVDNGIGKATAFQDFCLKAGLHIHYSKPYEPTHKSTVERIFGYMKNEFDVLQDNYVGSNHPVEGRHRTAKLSAEECKITFEEYAAKLDEYINGFFETRTRQRVIDNKKINVSIADLFNSYWQGYEKKVVNNRILRMALQSVKRLKYSNGLMFTMKNVVYNFMPDPNLSTVFNGRKYDVYYFPNDLSSVDIYAIDYMLDKNTGEYFNAGQFVAQLENYTNYQSAERRGKINQFNSKQNKKMKELAELHVDVVIASEVTNTGKVNDKRKQIKKAVYNVIKDAMPVERIENIIVNASDVKTEGALEELHANDKIEITADDYAELDK